MENHTSDSTLSRLEKTKAVTIVQTQKSIIVHCPNCGHFKMRHEKGYGCLVCDFLIQKGMQNTPRCRESYQSRLPQSEIDKAVRVPKTQYEGRTRCASCMEIWWAHDGLLCPNGMTLFVPLIEA